MIHGNDTLPYQDKLVILADTEYYGNKIYYPRDTLYEGACHTFEKINGQIVNLSDGECLRQGLWIITDSTGNYWTGIYKNNLAVGIWKQYDKNRKLIKEQEDITLGSDSYKVKETDYSGGQMKIITNRRFLAFFLKYFYIIVSIIFGAFFSRYFINSKIYNRENGTHNPAIYFGFPFTKRYWEVFSHSIMCMFTFWFFNYKPENRRLVLISNTLSIISLGVFFGVLIGLAVSGELH